MLMMETGKNSRYCKKRAVIPTQERGDEKLKSRGTGKRENALEEQKKEQCLDGGGGGGGGLIFGKE